MSVSRFIGLALLIGLAAPVLAQPNEELPIPQPTDGERLFGLDFEFAGSGHRILHFEARPLQNYANRFPTLLQHAPADPAAASLRQLAIPCVSGR